MKRACMRVGVLLTVLCTAPSVMAEAIPVSLGEFTGRSGDRLKEAVVNAISASDELRLSTKSPLVVAGKTKRKRRRTIATLVVTDRTTGVEVARHKFKGRAKVWNSITEEFWVVFGQALTSAYAPHIPPPPKKEPDPPKPPPVSKPPVVENEEPATSSGASPLEVFVGARIFNRSFAYTDDIYGVMRDYNVGAAPAVVGELTWFPGAHWTDGPGAHIGIRFRGHGVIGLASETADGARFETRAFGLEGGLVGRIPLLAHAFLLDLSMGWDVFDVDTDGAEGALLPAIGHTWVRAGAGFEVVLGAGVHIRGDFGWLFVLDTGEFGSNAWFPRLTAGGLTGALWVGVDVFEGLTIQAGFEARRYWTAMLPEYGDKYIVGGSVDQYLMGTLRIGYRMP